MKSIIEHNMLGDRINTISGKAEYLCTELEILLHMIKRSIKFMDKF